MQSLQEVGWSLASGSLAWCESSDVHGREYRIGHGSPTSERQDLARMICKPIRTCHLGKLLGLPSATCRHIPDVQNLSMGACGLEAADRPQR